MNFGFQRMSLPRLYSILFVLVLITFSALKFQHLFLPYFWDELGVYSQCAVYQYHHGISLMPASLPSELSRGHPLLLTVINATLMKVFGTSVVVPHTFHLLVSLVLFWVVYYYSKKYFNPLTGLVAVVLLAVQPIFFVQSILLLPEVFISLLLFVAVVAYYEEKYYRFALFASLAILTKESAMVLPAACLAYSVFRFVCFRKAKAAFAPLHILLTMLPYGVFGLFLLVQKKQMGWFFFPYHIDGIEWSFVTTQRQFNEFFDLLFWNQGRYWWKNVIVIGLIVSVVFGKVNRTTLRESLLVPLAVFVLAFLTFCCISNFYMGRYALVIIVFLAVFTSVALNSFLRKPLLVVLAVALLSSLAIGKSKNFKFEYDEDLGYVDCVSNLQQAVRYCESDTSTQLMVGGNFPAYCAFNFKESGYLSKPEKFVRLNAENLVRGYYVKVTPDGYDNLDRNNLDADLVKSFRQGYATADVYLLRKKAANYSSNP